MAKRTANPPDDDQLYEIAAAQAGYFTTQQSLKANISPPLLSYKVRTGRFLRVQRGIYRITQYPPSEHEELVVAWLWSKQAGVISHETVLALHGLSDVLPASIHLTLPLDWQDRKLKVPPNLALHHAEVPSKDRTWFGEVPITCIKRTLNDCANDGLSPELLRQAARQALQRNMIARSEMGPVEVALQPFGGLPT
jgi:predicted transcriptional regulator of viral defense system